MRVLGVPFRLGSRSGDFSTVPGGEIKFGAGSDRKSNREIGYTRLVACSCNQRYCSRLRAETRGSGL